MALYRGLAPCDDSIVGPRGLIPCDSTLSSNEDTVSQEAKVAAGTRRTHWGKMGKNILGQDHGALPQSAPGVWGKGHVFEDFRRMRWKNRRHAEAGVG